MFKFFGVDDEGKHSAFRNCPKKPPLTKTGLRDFLVKGRAHTFRRVQPSFRAPGADRRDQ